MSRKINKVNVSIAKPHALVILITIIICSSLWFFISPVVSGGFNLSYSHLIIPIAFLVLFKLIVSRLPYAYKEGILRQMSENGMYTFMTFMGVICSFMIANSIHFTSREIITIAKIDEIFNYPREKYFLLGEGMEEPSLIETSYYTYVTGSKGAVHYKISFLYGGFVGDWKDIFIFSRAGYLLGEEYSASDEIKKSKLAEKKSKLAEKIQKAKMNDFTKNGGYIYKLTEFDLVNLKNRITITDGAFEAYAHIREDSSPFEGAGMFGAFSFAFGLLAMLVAIPDNFFKKRKK